MRTLSARKYKIWEDNDTSIEVERKNVHVVANRKMCSDDWVLRFYEIDNFNEPFKKDEYKNVSCSYIRQKIEDFFNTCK